MRTRVQRWGNSLAFRVPRPFAEEIGLLQGTEVDMVLSDGKLVLTPLPVAKYTLGQLLADVTEDNLHGEWNTGPPVGKEAG